MWELTVLLHCECREVRGCHSCPCRRVKSERASASFSSTLEETVVPMDSLGEAFDRLANDNRVGSYVKAGARQVLL